MLMFVFIFFISKFMMFGFISVFSNTCLIISKSYPSASTCNKLILSTLCFVIKSLNVKHCISTLSIKLSTLLNLSKLFFFYKRN